ncbi:MAG TPA: hypothetical protein VL358_08820 [Caulobacteraceae bacterium]|jgi:hypothetical protein|nr:hypothetical protein [Caulobacteraceae bacterium]
MPLPVHLEDAEQLLNQATGDFEYSELVISFFPPEEKEGNPGDWWACANLDCKYFVKQLEVGGGGMAFTP